MSIQYKNSDILSVPNVAALFTLKNLADNQLVQTQGYSAEGVGSNLYRYDASSVATIDGGFVLPGPGGTLSFSGTTFNGGAGDGGRFIAVDLTIADVTKFGAVGDGSTNNWLAIQLALNAASSTAPDSGFGGVVRIPRGSFAYTGMLTIPTRCSLIGDNKRTTALLWTPDSNAIAIDVYSGSTARMYDVTLSDFELRSSASSDKVGVRIIDAQDCVFRDLHIRFSESPGPRDDIGIAYSGVENNTFERIRIQTPTGIRVYDDVDAQTDAPDNTVFRDIIITPTPDTISNPRTGIWVDEVNLSNISFCGRGVVALGDHLIYWEKTSGTVSQGFVMSGWRHEQATDAAAYSIHIDMTGSDGVESIVLNGVRTGSGCGGIYARNARITMNGGIIANNSSSGATAKCIDIDETFLTLSSVNSVPIGAVAPSFGESRVMLASPEGGSYATDKLDSSLIVTPRTTTGDNQKPNCLFGTPVYTRKFSIPVGKRQRQSFTSTVAGASNGIVMISVYSRSSYEFGIAGIGNGNVQGTSRGTYLISNSPNFSVTPNAASKFNLWTGSADLSTVYLQNNLALVSAAVTADAATDTFTSVSHPFSNGYKVTIHSTGTLPTGVDATTDYYIINSATDTFQLSLTTGGSAVDITTDGTATITVYELAEGMIWVFMDATKPDGNSYRQRDWL